MSMRPYTPVLTTVFRYTNVDPIERAYRTVRLAISRRNLGAISSDLGAISAPALELGDELGQVGAELGEVTLGGLLVLLVRG